MDGKEINLQTTSVLLFLVTLCWKDVFQYPLGKSCTNSFGKFISCMLFPYPKKIGVFLINIKDTLISWLLNGNILRWRQKATMEERRKTKKKYIWALYF